VTVTVTQPGPAGRGTVTVTARLRPLARPDRDWPLGVRLSTVKLEFEGLAALAHCPSHCQCQAAGLAEPGQWPLTGRLPASLSERR
jgi:hypothetical protein